MNTRVIIIHSSEIIRLGLSTIVKRLFDIDAVALPAVDQLNNYRGIDHARLLILAEAGWKKKEYDKITSSFREKNSVKIVLINHAPNDPCSEDAGSLTIHASKADIYSRLSPLLKGEKSVSDTKSPTSLTEREVEVLKLVAFGKTNKEMAEALFISIHTVISHRKNITEKLSIKSISGLTVYAILNKLIDTTTIDPESLI